MNEIEILEKVKELLWSGKDEDAGRLPKGFGSSEYICHIMRYVVTVHMDRNANEAWLNVKAKVYEHCDNYSCYSSQLINLGLIDEDFDKSDLGLQSAQNYRMMLINQLINYYKEFGCSN